MIKTINPNDISRKDLHHFLLSAVAPRPICFASTISASGNVNLSPFSFFNVFSSNPPILIFSPARSGVDNSTKHTLDNVLEVKETVINVVNYDMVEQMSLASTTYDKGINEFVKAGFTAIDSIKVKPPRVAEAPVSFECIVDEVKALGDGPGAGNLIIAKVVMIHVNEDYFDDTGRLDTVKLDLVGRMGGAYYNRCTPDALFSIPKPTSSKGIGIDSLPQYVRESDFFKGNELARMGNLAASPEFSSKPLFKNMNNETVKLEILKSARQFILDNEEEKALSLLINSESYFLNT